MDAYEVVRQAVKLLQEQGRLTYRMLKRQFHLDDEVLEDVKEELLFSHPVVDENGRGLAWTGDAEASSKLDAHREADAEARFHAILPALTALLQREGRVTYPSLRQIFGLDEVLLGNLRKELILRRLAVDEDGQVLAWTGEAQSATQPAISTAPPALKPAAITVVPDTPRDVSIEAESPRTAPQAEHRQLTVMFCDLADSTRLSQQLDPEDLREVVRAYQATAAEVVQQYDGHMAQYLGDGLLIYFGWPQAHEDDAQRALYAGLGIIDAMVTLNRRLGEEKRVKLTVRLGVHTGPVVVGEMGGGGRHENLATGETVNIAARLEGLAAPNTVVISGMTERLVHSVFVLDDLGPQVLKGVAEPLPTFRVIGPVENEEDEPSAIGIPFLVGRDEEVGLLMRRWEQAKEGLGQVVLISGEAGIGKSSLIAMLRHQVRRAGYTRMTFRCSPYHTNSALYPVIEHVQRVLQFQTGDLPETKLDKLEGVLKEYSRPLEEVVPLYAALLSVPVPDGRYPAQLLSPQQQRQQTQDALVGWLLEEAERQPTLAMWEDLHWADPSTLELLGLLLEQTPTVAMLNVLTFRPEFEPPWSNRSHMTPIVLNRLERPQVEALITHLARDKALPAEVVEHIISKTDGVPLYVEELTKMLLESELLREDIEQYVLIGPLGTVAIPDTLQDSLMARLDQLKQAKEVAQLASVLGREFDYEMLQPISSQDDETFQASLRQLVDAELLYQRGRAPRAKYIFKHALIQDAAYASLLRRTRQQLHRQIAQLLEAQFSEMATHQPELVAYHYTEAECYDLAIEYWQRAATGAGERSAHTEASHHLTQALACLATRPETPARHQHELELRLAIGPVLNATKSVSNPEVEQNYIRARELCEQLPETPQRFLVLRGLWMYYMTRGELQTSRELEVQLLQFAEELQEPLYLSSAHQAIGTTVFWLGKFFQARTHFEQAVTFYQALQPDSPTFQDSDTNGPLSLAWLTWTLWILGYPEQALHQMHQSLRLALEQSDAYALSTIHCFATMFHAFRRDWQTTQIHAETGLTLATEQGFPLWRAVALSWRGAALATQGNREEGMAQMQEGIAVLRSIGMGLNRSRYLIMIAEAYGTVGEEDQGLNALTEALEVKVNTGECCYEAEIYRLKGELLLRQSTDHVVQAEASYNQALVVARQQQAKSWELRAATSLARLWQSQGKRQEAYDLLAPVYGWFTEGFDTADLQDAKVLLDQLAG